MCVRANVVFAYMCECVCAYVSVPRYHHSTLLKGAWSLRFKQEVEVEVADVLVCERGVSE